jgi:hypothetical protein
VLDEQDATGADRVQLIWGGQVRGRRRDGTAGGLEQTERLTRQSPEQLVELDVEAHRHSVNDLLLRTSELVRAEVRRPAKRRNHRIGGDLTGATLIRANLKGADLIGVDLTGADLRGANLRGACLIGADLTGANLSMADLIGADLRAADLGSTDLTTSIFLTQFQLNATKGDVSTRVPSSLIRPTHWPSG